MNEPGVTWGGPDGAQAARLRVAACRGGGGPGSGGSVKSAADLGSAHHPGSGRLARRGEGGRAGQHEPGRRDHHQEPITP